MSSAARGRAALLALGAIAALLTGCSHGGSSLPATTRAPAAAPAARWWSSAGLRRTDHDYCRLLRQTVSGSAAGTRGVSTARRAADTTAFLAALASTAPDGVAHDWTVVGTALRAATAPGHGRNVDESAVRAATARIGTDAHRRCGLHLARGTPR